MRPRVLIVDDDRTTLDTYAKLIELEGYEVKTAETAAGLVLALEMVPDVILLDLHVADDSGATLLEKIREAPALAGTGVAIVTGDYRIDDATRAAIDALGAEVRHKPLWADDLTPMVEALAGRARARVNANA